MQGKKGDFRCGWIKVELEIKIADNWQYLT